MTSLPLGLTELQMANVLDAAETLDPIGRDKLLRRLGAWLLGCREPLDDTEFAQALYRLQAELLAEPNENGTARDLAPRRRRA